MALARLAVLSANWGEANTHINTVNFMLNSKLKPTHNPKHTLTEQEEEDDTPHNTTDILNTKQVDWSDELSHDPAADLHASPSAANKYPVKLPAYWKHQTK